MLRDYVKSYRNSGYTSAFMTAKKIANECEIEAIFKLVRGQSATKEKDV